MSAEIQTVLKPWGYEEIWALTEDYVGKYLYIKDGHRLSRQYHKTKEETVRVLEGILTVEIGDATSFLSRQLKEGEVYHVTPRTIHRFGADNGDVRMVEVSTPHLEDVVRLEDDYARNSS